MTTSYDVIGDVHGSVAKLEGLLSTLGYRRAGRTGPWHHPERIAVFAGDLIDRGPGQRRTVELVRAMVEAGTALAILGNHEFNAIGYATPAGSGDGHLRRRSRRHFEQHETFLTEYPLDSDDHADVIDWFRSLPLWLELEGLRVVHACWSNAHVELLRAAHGGPHLPSGPALEPLYTEGHPLDDAIEVVLKGPEVELPQHLWYRDKEGHERSRARYQWWGDGADTLRERAVFIPGSLDIEGNPHPGFDDTPITQHTTVPYDDPTPVIVGHYWLSGSPEPRSDRVACVDYSAVKNGQLVAYRYDGETTLTRHHMIAFP